MAGTQATSCSVEFDGTTVFTCGSNSATVQETITPFGFSNICANSYQGLNLSSAFKSALYDSIKAKDCLCSGELRDWGPGFTAIILSSLTTRILGAASFACFLPISKPESKGSGSQQHPWTVDKHASFATVSQLFYGSSRSFSRKSQVGIMSEMILIRVTVPLCGEGRWMFLISVKKKIK